MARVPRRTAALVAAAVLGTALFARLGMWQLDRLYERRARNRLVASHLGDPPVALAQVGADSSSLYRRVRITGTYEGEHEIVLADRVRDGAPGVQLITPARIDSGIGGDTLLLVNRGWVYAPDGMSVDEAAWREDSRFSASGYVQQLSVGRGVPSISSAHPNRMRWLDAQVIARFVGHPVTPYQVVLLPDSDRFGSIARSEGPHARPANRRTPARIEPPPLDEGPHLSYAIQWFSFAAIALAGAGAAVVMDRRRDPGSHLH
jgi:surfeit locus 1 family protein